MNCELYTKERWEKPSFVEPYSVFELHSFDRNRMILYTTNEHLKERLINSGLSSLEVLPPSEYLGYRFLFSKAELEKVKGIIEGKRVLSTAEKNKCKVCGEVFERRSPRQKYCLSCKRKVLREQWLKSKKSRKNKERAYSNV